MLTHDRQYCKHSHPVVVHVPVNRGRVVSYYTKVIMVPCGKCEYCRRKMQNYWSSRLYYEGRRWTKTHYRGKIFFCTFTISNEWFVSHASELCPEIRKDMPKFVYDGDIDSIQVTPVAKYIYNKYWKGKFLDMLRMPVEKRGVGCKGLKYYTCCEFGDQTERIHFHSILYVPDFQVIKEYCYKHKIRPKKPWYVKGKNLPNGQKRLSTLEERYMEAFTDSLWSTKGIQIGHTNVNEACAKSFRYITKYVCKIQEDEDVNKCPFHRQSQELGLDIEKICSALQDNKPYYLIETCSKEYKVPISKYYRKKYALLLGIEDQFAMSFIEQADRLYNEAADLLGYEKSVVFEARNGDAIDVLNNDLRCDHYVTYIDVPTYTREKFVIDGKIKYLWCLKIRRVPTLEESITYLNGFPYEQRETGIRGNEAFEEGYTRLD